MNRGYGLSKWFAKEFGSTQCQAITHCNFSDAQGVSQYIDGGCITRCKLIAGRVAEKVQAKLARDRNVAPGPIKTERSENHD